MAASGLDRVADILPRDPLLPSPVSGQLFDSDNDRPSPCPSRHFRPLGTRQRRQTPDAASRPASFAASRHLYLCPIRGEMITRSELLSNCAQVPSGQRRSPVRTVASVRSFAPALDTPPRCGGHGDEIAEPRLVTHAMYTVRCRSSMRGRQLMAVACREKR